MAFVRVRGKNLYWALDKGIYISAILMIIFAFLIINFYIADLEKNSGG
jgi:hypothetical protein